MISPLLTTALIPQPKDQPEISNLELRTTLLALAKQSEPQNWRRQKGVHKLDLFSEGSPNELRAFIFQCSVYFCACTGEFTKDLDKVFSAISYLQRVALDYFKLYINKPDPEQSFDFLENWLVFIQKLTNMFGSYSPEDNDEDAIISLSFSSEEKAINYFIQFAKYQTHIR